MKKCLFCFFLLLFIAPCIMQAQNLTLEKQVIGSAGMVSQTNSSGFELSGILGQTAIEIVRSTGATYDVHQGFWNWADEDFVGVEDNAAEVVNLSNYPNPFSNNTSIKYFLENPAYVTIRIYDANGNLIRTLMNEQFQGSGEQTLPWDGKNSSGMDAASGSYLYELSINQVSMTGGTGSDVVRVRNVMMIVR